jgi:uncharacterized membrane protein YbhN (UPF0104 family)
LGDTSSRGLRARLLLVLVNLVSIGCLVWTLRDAKLGELRDDLATMDWKWVAVAIVADIAVYFCYGLRWNLLLRPLVRVGPWRAIRAIYVGLFANEILPLRAGEVLRCYLISRWTQLPFSVSLTSALIERIFDGIWLSLCLLVTLHYVPFPRQFRYLVDGGYVLGVVVLAGVVLLAAAMFFRGRGAPLVPPVAQPRLGWRKHVAVLMDDLALIGHSRYLYLALFQSLPCLLLQAIPVWAAFKGYGFDLSLADAFALTVILRLTSALPQAPGNIGLFQLFTKEVLIHIFNVVPDEAGRFSVLLWGIVTLPLLVGGFVALSIEEADLIQLKRDAQEEAAGLRTQR